MNGDLAGHTQELNHEYSDKKDVRAMAARRPERAMFFWQRGSDHGVGTSVLVARAKGKTSLLREAGRILILCFGNRA